MRPSWWLHTGVGSPSFRDPHPPLLSLPPSPPRAALSPGGGRAGARGGGSSFSLAAARRTGLRAGAGPPLRAMHRQRIQLNHPKFAETAADSEAAAQKRVSLCYVSEGNKGTDCAWGMGMVGLGLGPYARKVNVATTAMESPPPPTHPPSSAEHAGACVTAFWRSCTAARQEATRARSASAAALQSIAAPRRSDGLVSERKRCGNDGKIYFGKTKKQYKSISCRSSSRLFQALKIQDISSLANLLTFLLTNDCKIGTKQEVNTRSGNTIR